MQVTTRQVTAPDGWRLHAQVVEPDGPARGLVVAGHAMMVDSRTLWRADRACLVQTLAQAGMRVLVVDLRGHGQSGPRADAGGHWTYDELVADTAVWRDLADELADGLAIFWLSHSLFGHTSLAWFGQNPQRLPTAFVALAVNAWNRQFEPNPALWLVKALMLKTARLAAERTGRLPAKRMGMGNHDESLDYWRDLTRMAMTRWQSRTGTDYLAGLAAIARPALCVFSDGDKLFTRPVDGIGFTALLPQRQILTLGAACKEPSLRGLVPGHMAMVTDVQSEPLWRHIATWLLART